MVEIGYNETTDGQGNIIESIPFEISDDELLLRELATQVNIWHHQDISAYGHWDSLELKEKAKILKELLGATLSILERLEYFAL